MTLSAVRDTLTRRRRRIVFGRLGTIDERSPLNMRPSVKKKIRTRGTENRISSITESVQRSYTSCRRFVEHTDGAVRPFVRDRTVSESGTTSPTRSILFTRSCSRDHVSLSADLLDQSFSKWAVPLPCGHSGPPGRRQKAQRTFQT